MLPGAMEPHRDRLWPWDAVAAAVWLILSHAFPQEPYPEWRALGMGVPLVLVLLRTAQAWRTPKSRAAAAWALASLAVFPIGAWVSTRLGPNPPEGAVLLGTWLQGALWGTWAALLAAQRGEPALKAGLLSLGIVAAVSALYGFYHHAVVRPDMIRLLEAGHQFGDFTSDQLLGNIRQNRMTSTFGDPNHLGLICAAGAVALLGLAATSAHRLPLVILASLACIVLAAEIMTVSRGGLLSLFAGLIALAVGLLSAQGHLRGKSLAYVIGGLILLGAVTVGALWLVSPGALQRLGNLTTVRERLGYWRIAWSVFWLNPLLGQGAGGFVTWYLMHRPEGLGEAKFAHSLPLEILADTGILGAALLVLPFLPGLRGAGATHQVPVLIAVLTVFVINSLVQFSILFRELWVDFMLVTGLWLGLSLAARVEGSRSGWTAAGPFLMALAVALIAPADLRRARTEIIDDVALAALGSGDAALALEMTHRMIDLEPGYDRWRVRGAQNLIALAQSPDAPRLRLLAEAEQHLAVAERLNPRRPSIYTTRSELMSRRGDHEGAARELRRALERDPFSPELRAQMARAWATLGAFASAEEEAQRAIRLSRGDERALLVWAELLLEQARLTEARETVGEMLRRRSGNVDALKLLAEIELAEGDRGAARAAARRAVALRPWDEALRGWAQRLSGPE